LRQAETWPEEAQEELADAALEIAAGLKGSTRRRTKSSPESTAGWTMHARGGLQQMKK
jgi:hypothetical protein